MRRISGKISSIRSIVLLLTALVLAGAWPYFTAKSLAAELGTRSLELSDSVTGGTDVTYNLSFDIATAGTLGSIEVEFCSNSTFISDPCAAPVGLDATNALLGSESGVSGFGISPASTANDIILTRTPAPTATVAANLVFGGMTNPGAAGADYVRVLTFPTDDATGTPTDTGGLAFAINPAVNVSTYVPPYLAFCTGNTISGTNCSTASGDYIDLGAFAPTRTSGGQSQFVAATNAQSGYNISVSGTTLESGNNIIPAMQTAGIAQPGVSKFGINLRTNANPRIGANPSGKGLGAPTANYNQPNLYHYADGDVIASSTHADDYRKYTVSYVVDVSSAQAIGVYASTFTYTALANF
ncbi:MAG TPA: hypothetical protein VGG13_02105 [Candidatus Saccharimonadales bacterium]|jgi:hypothetical protein